VQHARRGGEPGLLPGPERRRAGMPGYLLPAELELGDREQTNQRSAAWRMAGGLGKLNGGGATRSRTSSC
jgi:hypothetical protein